MTDQHPITPPPELVQQWANAWHTGTSSQELLEYVATQAARWGADQELEACCEWFVYTHPDDRNLGALRAARRPKPPSLKRQALAALEVFGPGADLTLEEINTIRRALEQIDD